MWFYYIIIVTIQAREKDEEEVKIAWKNLTYEKAKNEIETHLGKKALDTINIPNEKEMYSSADECVVVSKQKIVIDIDLSETERNTNNNNNNNNKNNNTAPVSILTPVSDSGSQPRSLLVTSLDVSSHSPPVIHSPSVLPAATNDPPTANDLVSDSSLSL
jgi:hypothetical protein